MPTLGHCATNRPRSIVVMDNASIHKDPRIKTAIEAAGARVIWTAAYSPDLNPIERCFNHYKSFLKRHRKAFFRRPLRTHRLALQSISGATMRKLFRGQALRGAVRNVLTDEELQTIAMAAAMTVAVVVIT